MFVNTITWPFRGFGQLAAYITKEQGTEHDYGLEIFHNVWASDELQEIVDQFAENDAYRPRRKNQTGLVHEILSFSGEDRENITPQIIRDVAERWLEERAPRGLAYGCVHQDRDHLHLHLMISGNEYRSERSTRLDLKDFYRIRREIEFYTRENYRDELAHSIAYTGWMDTPEQERLSKDQVSEILSEALSQTHSIDEVNQNLAAHGLEVYWYHGRPAGVRQGNRKFRWKRLAIDPPAFKYPDPDLKRVEPEPELDISEQQPAREEPAPTIEAEPTHEPQGQPVQLNEPRFDYTFETEMWERELERRETDSPAIEAPESEAEPTEGVSLDAEGGEGIAGKAFVIGYGLYSSARMAASLVGTGLRMGKEVAKKGIDMMQKPDEKKAQTPASPSPASSDHAARADEKDEVARQLLGDIRRFREAQSRTRDRSRGADYER